jgi:hypothetical protein
MKTLAPFNKILTNSVGRKPCAARRDGFLFIPLILVCFALSPGAQAVEPTAPDTALAGGNTADGQNALLSYTTGTFNTAIGFDSLVVLTDTSFNTGVGAGTLLLNTGNQNTAVGAGALLSNSTGEDNNAVGAFALFNSTTAFFNNAHGREALFANVDGSENNAFGDLALENNTSGASNTAIGDDAGRNIQDGSFNVCVGDEAGTAFVSANNNIAIGAPGAGPFADISNTCFIGSIYNQPVSDPGTAQDTFVDQFNVLGFVPSSRRYKHDIQPMDKASEKLYGLKPVTFKYNGDKKGMTQYGVIAEDVAEVAPDLVFRDKNGDVQTVRFEQISAMLLNEFLKAHRKAQQQEATITQLKKDFGAMIAQLTARLEEQAAQIQKVSAQFEASKPASQVVNNNH